MSSLLYNKKSVIGRLYLHFSVYFSALSTPTGTNLFLLVLSILALESANSIRFLHRHFLCKITEKSLNAFYYACSYAKVDYSKYLSVTASLAMGIIPENLLSQPVFLCIDDTMIEKHGKKFENVSKLFDHASHNGSNYLNGHCFVSLMLRVPVWNRDCIAYQPIPLGYRMWKKEKTKLVMASEMIQQIMPALEKACKVIVLCDSWYGKSEIFALTHKFPAIEVICNVRHDTVLYDLKPDPTGKRGRPSSHGRRLSIKEDFMFCNIKIGNFNIAKRKVLTNLLKGHIMEAYVTNPDNAESRRLFLSTVSAEDLSMPFICQQMIIDDEVEENAIPFLPYAIYSFRWKIEVSYYEQKTFWSLCGYMLRSADGIEMLLNLVNISYSAMKILPFADKSFSQYQNMGTQEFRFVLSQKIHEQVFMTTFVKSAEKVIKIKRAVNRLKQWISTELYAA